MKKLKGFVSLIMVICFIITASPMVNAQDYGSYLDSMLKFMTNMYYEGLTDKEGLERALKGMFSELDNYSAYYNREETEALYNNLNNNYAGIGAVLENHDSGVLITEVYEDSPAEKAGLKAGDLITDVDGKSVVGMEAAAAASLIRGEVGTVVRLTIKRQGSVKSISIVRAQIKLKSVHHKIEGSIGYIKLDSFNEGVSSEFNKVLTDINKKSIRKLIIDLRGNPGGYVDEAVAIAQKLMPKGPITTLDYRSEEFIDHTYYSEGGNPKYIIAVLIDEDSASASEILAGALQDSGTGILIGKTSYGKGVFQSIFSILTPEAYNKYGKEYGEKYVTTLQWYSYHEVFPYKEDILGTVKLTTGYYLTPKGKSIHEIGLKPLFDAPNPTYPNGINLSLIAPITNTKSIKLEDYGENVYNAERILVAAGYLDSKADRLFENDTYEALRTYQADKKLSVNGIIGIETRNTLNDTLNELVSQNDKQYTKAIEILKVFRD